MNRSVFLSGIGGIGMANLAVLLQQAGFTVAGSDGSIYEPASSILRNAGIQVRSPYSEHNVPRDGTPIIVGNALSRGHAEVEAALNAGSSLYSFPDFLNRFILAGRHSMVVAGTHGKSTTAACLAHILQRCGLNPGFLVGAMPLDFPTGAQFGSPGSPFVLEGDEYDSAFFDKRSKFLHYFPRTLLLGPVEYDHADIFTDEAEMLLAFRRLIQLLPANGRLIYCADSAAACELAKRAPCPTLSVGFASDAAWRLLDAPGEFVFTDPDGNRHALKGGLPGRHNRMNTLMAIAAATAHTGNFATVRRAAEFFSGIRRRLEQLFDNGRWTVYDDFAHHPTAIAAALNALREAFPQRKLIAVLEPRSNTMVRNLFQTQIAVALSAADEVVVGTIYRAERIPLEQRLNLKRLQMDVVARGKPCALLDNARIPAFLEAMPACERVVVFMSNGSFDGVPHEFVRRVSKLK